MSDVTTPSSSGLQAAFRSDAGRVRANNEDVPLVDPDRGVFGVIDGVGGHAAGEVAAGIACDVILQRLARPLGTPAERVREAIAIANNEIFRRAEESPELRGMTCVVTLAIAADRLLTIGHVGDSRLYKLRADGMRKLTHDHSPVGEREDAQEISEVEAMHHPRRNEVFRDVGSTFRDKDEEDFVEVIEEPIERDCAILLCTDGLTDMLPSASIEHIVRQHAGSPQDVVDALVAAANDAGGRDNVTVVYAEAPDFARVLRRKATSPDQPGPAPANMIGPGDGPARAATAANRAGTAPAPAAQGPNRVAMFGRWIVRSRSTWFAFGALAGVVAALVLVWRLGGPNVGGGRTLVVGTAGGDSFSRIVDAMNAARPGDVVRLDPGIYREAVVLRDGVDLVARVPGTVTFARPSDANGEVVAISASGSMGARISGIRIESTPDAPIDVGMRLSGQGRTIELMDVTGSMQAGIELMAAGAATIQGSLLAVQGLALVLADGSQALLTNNVFLRTTRPVESPISITRAAQLTLRRNVFAGYGSDIVKGVPASELQQMLGNNFVIGSEPSQVR